MPVLVALSRMYRGEHHPTDIAGSLLFAGLWLTATTFLIRPNDAGRVSAARGDASARRDASARGDASVQGGREISGGARAG
jgi:undecaprenyl-diphosphatase